MPSKWGGKVLLNIYLQQEYVMPYLLDISCSGISYSTGGFEFNSIIYTAYIKLRFFKYKHA